MLETRTKLDEKESTKGNSSQSRELYRKFYSLEKKSEVKVWARAWRVD